jgi:hypothetical protein
MQTPAHDGLAAAIAARALTLGPVRADCQLELTGILLHAEVAMKPVGDGHFVPAIVLELDDVGAGHHRIAAHIPFPLGERDKAEAQAKALHRGERITVTTQLTDLRLMLPAASLSPTP